LNTNPGERQNMIDRIRLTLSGTLRLIVAGGCSCILVALWGCSGKGDQRRTDVFLQSAQASETSQHSLWKSLNGPLSEDVLSVLVLKDGRILAGTHERIVVSTDRGVSWFVAGTPGVPVTSLTNAPGGRIIAVAGSGLQRVVISSDQGITWRTLRLRGDTLWAQVFSSENGSLIFGDRKGMLYHTDTFGDTCSIARIPAGSGKLHAIGFERDREAIMVTDKKKILISHNDGLSWSATGTEYPYGISTVHILENGEYLVIMGNGWLYKSADRGKTWTENRALDFRGAFLNLGDGHLLAASMTRGLMESRDFGKTWESLGLAPAFITSAVPDPEGNFVVSTYSRGLFRRDGKTGQWALLSPGWSPANLLGVTWDSRGILYARGINGAYRSDDNGDTWHSIMSSLEDLYITSLIVDRDDRVYTVSWTGYVMTSSDWGATWDCLNKGGTDYGRIGVMSLALDSSGHIYAGCNGDGVMILSAKEKKLIPLGDAWERVEQLLYDFSSRSFFALKVDYVPADMGLHSDDIRQCTLWRSGDSCRTWKLLLGDTVGVECMSLAPSGTLVVGTDESGLLRSTDHGEHWDHLGLAGVMRSDVAIIDTSTIVAVTSDSVYMTTDAGKIWRPVFAARKSAEARFVALSPDNYLLIGGYRIGLLRSSVKLPDWVRLVGSASEGGVVQ
jgi:photosystem II stability/assembly factor-like uncharacterized protein